MEFCHGYFAKLNFMFTPNEIQIQYAHNIKHMWIFEVVNKMWGNQLILITKGWCWSTKMTWKMRYDDHSAKSHTCNLDNSCELQHKVSVHTCHIKYMADFKSAPDLICTCGLTETSFPLRNTPLEHTQQLNLLILLFYPVNLTLSMWHAWAEDKFKNVTKVSQMSTF